MLNMYLKKKSKTQGQKWPNLVSLHVTGVKGFFSLLINWVPAGSVSYWLAALGGRDIKNPANSLHWK
jgi:hypothetical protein